jgi:SAM-dependent methyltransferase
VNRSDFEFLLSAAGQQLLAETAAAGLVPDSHLPLAMKLREQVGAARAAAILETVTLRQRAAVKFSRAGQMYFERAALEQASAELVAAYRAERYGRLGVRWVADLGCGLGGDALGLAAHSHVIGVERLALRLAMARENLRAYGLDGRFHPLQADLLTLPPLPVEAVFADPARRDETGRRLASVHDYQPPLSYLDRWRQRVTNLGVKISPAVDYAELPAAAEVEFISVQGELREGVLWFGGLRTAAARRATLLPGGHSLTDEAGEVAVAVTPIQDYLIEPDAAVIRAHLVQQLAAQLGATKIDETIAFLTAPTPPATPLARTYEVEAAFPFQLKRLRAYLRERQIGRVTIKKRGSPLEVEALRRQLRLQGEAERLLVLTQVGGVATAVIARPYAG